MAEQLAKVGDVIQAGESIPDNVTAFTDNEDDAWRRAANGHWHLAANADRCDAGVWCSQSSRPDVTGYAPLTVTAVREPEPDDVVHYRIPGDASATTLCGVDVWDESTSVTERAGSATCEACRTAADEDVKPQQADASVLLDLVRQYGAAAHKDGYFGASARPLFDRIAALVPLIPQQARDCLGEAFWQHDFCGEVYSDQKHHEQFCDPGGPWRPLLVGDDPAPEGEEVERLRRLLKTQAENFLAATDKLIAEREDAPDPLVLTLPQVPEGAVALGGASSGTRYPAHESGGWRNPDDGGAPWKLSAVLDREGSVTVEMAPPREPRTWPKLDGAPDEVRKVRGQSGCFYIRTNDPTIRGASVPLWAWSNGSMTDLGNARPFSEWQELDGPLTEVFDEPGGQQ